MMAAYLEDFGVDTIVEDDDQDAAEEEQRLAVFEQGYAAGWDDAIAAQARNTQVATEEFAKNLTDLSFTYQEAVQQTSAALVPCLRALAEAVVPDALHAGLVQRIAAQLEDAIEVDGAAEIAVRCSSARHPIFSAGLPKLIDMPVRVIADNALATDEVSIRFETSERHIDLSELSQHICQSIEAFSFQLDRDRSNG